MAIFFITYFGLSNFATANLVNGTLSWPSSNLDYWIRWANWDGGHFRGIAENGYLPQQTVFFPLYPMLIKTLMSLGIHSLWGGLIVSHISAVAALFFIYKLALLDFSEDLAKKAVFIVLIFPTSFYLGAVYSEALFLALATSAFFFARKNSWLLAAVLAGLASATRLVGVVIILAIFVEYFLKSDPLFRFKYLWSTLPRRLLIILSLFSLLFAFLQNIALYLSNYSLLGIISYLAEYTQPILYIAFILVILEFIKTHKNKKILSKNTLFLTLSLTPIPLYMYYQQIIFNSPFSFLTNEHQWGRAFSMPWQPVLSYINTLVEGLRVGGQANTLVEFSLFIISFICLVISLYKLRLSYRIYFAISLILPLFSGTLIAMPRYILIIFPLFLILAMIKNELAVKIVTIFSLLLLGAYSILFINSYWVT